MNKNNYKAIARLINLYGNNKRELVNKLANYFSCISHRIELDNRDKKRKIKDYAFDREEFYKEAGLYNAIN